MKTEIMACAVLNGREDILAVYALHAVKTGERIANTTDVPTVKPTIMDIRGTINLTVCELCNQKIHDNSDVNSYSECHRQCDEELDRRIMAEMCQYCGKNQYSKDLDKKDMSQCQECFDSNNVTYHGYG